MPNKLASRNSIPSSESSSSRIPDLDRSSISGAGCAAAGTCFRLQALNCLRSAEASLLKPSRTRSQKAKTITKIGVNPEH